MPSCRFTVRVSIAALRIASCSTRLLATSSTIEHVFAAFERERQPDTAAIAQMALENYLEMRDGVRSPHLRCVKWLATELERRDAFLTASYRAIPW